MSSRTKFLCVFCSKVHRACNASCPTALMHVKNGEFTLSSFKDLFGVFGSAHLAYVFDRAIQVCVKLHITKTDSLKYLVLVKKVLEWQAESWKTDRHFGSYSEYLASPVALEEIHLDLPIGFPELIGELGVFNSEAVDEDILEVPAANRAAKDEDVYKCYTSKIVDQFTHGMSIPQKNNVEEALIWERQTWKKFPLTGPWSYFNDICLANGVELIVKVLNEDPLELEVQKLTEGVYVGNTWKFGVDADLKQALYYGEGEYIEQGVDIGQVCSSLKELKMCLVLVKTKLDYVKNMDVGQLYVLLEELKEYFQTLEAGINKLEDMVARLCIN